MEDFAIDDFTQAIASLAGALMLIQGSSDEQEIKRVAAMAMSINAGIIKAIDDEVRASRLSQA